ncbi:MAG: phosphate acyltransferase, partial [Chlamydiia bacterium]|nr:phosphate acyltransferase [Chlamydiia bacterium]
VIGSSSFASSTSIPYHTAKEVIGMEENPLTALRQKRHASIPVGLRLLKEGVIDAFISAGNTGALVSAAKMILGTLPTIRRPALLAMIPTKKRPVAVVDVGANIQVKTEHLVQFARIAAAYLKARGIEHPRIGLLNIGSEPIKGTSESRLAYKALQSLPESPFRFVGNIEGKSVFDGEVDGLITDGFTGNVFLKTAEGIASLILDRLEAHIPSDLLDKLTPQLADLQRHLHYADYPGALLVGVKKIVIKCHGYSTPHSVGKAVFGAVELLKQNFMEVFPEKLIK